MKKLQYLWDKINSSFWFIPILMLTMAIIAALWFIDLDTRLDYAHSGFIRFFYSGSVESARSILTIIAGATIGVAGTVFSITLVVLTLASSQLGSRLVKNFMYDKLNQVVLGTYVSTFVYCLIILNSIKGVTHNQFLPVQSVFAALIFAIAGIVLLIVFIHHVSVSIQSDKVISDISASMFKSIRKIFPQTIGQEQEKAAPDLFLLKKQFSHINKIGCTKGGYLQSIDGDGLMKITTENDILILIYQQPGDFLVKDITIAEVLSQKGIDEKIQKKINNNFIIGKTRSPLQDAEYFIHLMVEVASRALSPGINDPYIAITCIDNLTAVMSYLSRASFPSPYRYDQQGKLRVIAENHSFSGMLNASFNQIRQYAAASPSVYIRLLKAMITIRTITTKEAYKKDINLHANMILHTAERNIKEEHDLRNIKERFDYYCSLE